MAEYLSEEDMNTGEYISRDEALKIFHQCCDNCTSSYNGIMCRACADAGAMDILIDMPATDVQPINPWISVDEALPIYEGLVLAVDNNNTIRLGIYTDLGWTSQFGNSMVAHITYWQPLPEPPKDGDTNG